MKEYDKAIVNCKRIACNSCGPDEYEVTIKPHGEPEQVIYIYIYLLVLLKAMKQFVTEFIVSG